MNFVRSQARIEWINFEDRKALPSNLAAELQTSGSNRAKRICGAKAIIHSSRGKGSFNAVSKSILIGRFPCQMA